MFHTIFERKDSHMKQFIQKYPSVSNKLPETSEHGHGHTQEHIDQADGAS